MEGGMDASGVSCPVPTPGVTCPAPTPNGQTLPFVVDSVYITSGYYGDLSSIVEPLPDTCGGNRSSPTALGKCHTWRFSTAGAADPNSGVVWQYPANNWGGQVGYRIPPGATKVSFWVRGATGRERVSFGIGVIGYGCSPNVSFPCDDTVTGGVPVMTLPTTWTHVTIPITGGSYAGGVLTGFSWNVQPGWEPAGVPEITFYVDDIQWM
jgi:hypothetical protein